MTSFRPVRRSVKENAIQSDEARRLAQRIALCAESEALERFSSARGLMYGILPLRIEKQSGKEVLRAAGLKSMSFQQKRAIEFDLGVELEVYPVAEPVLKNAIRIAYHGRETSLKSSISELKQRYKEETSAGEKQVLQGLELLPKSGPALVLKRLLEHAVGLGASDLHITPNGRGSLVTVRINGQLLEHERVVANSLFHREIISRLKVLAGAPATRETEVFDGSFSLGVAGENYCFRLGVLPSNFGPKASLRIVSKTELSTFDELGIKAELQNRIEELLASGSAFVAFCGRAGAGKSSSCYATLRRAAALGYHCFSLEDPIERETEGITQIEVGAQLSFEKAFSAVLRADPNVIAVGEIRDKFAALTCLQAALSGHLILATLHAASPEAARERIKSLAEIESVSAMPPCLFVYQELSASAGGERRKLHTEVMDLRDSI